MRILFNHLGYTPGPISGILLEAPENTVWNRIELVRLPEQTLAGKASPRFVGRVPSWSCGPWWTLDELTVETPGRYALRWETPYASGQSEGFEVHEDVLGQRVISDMIFYFKGQRCSGIWDTADQQAPRLDDRQPRDVHGGWYDASGDTSKYLSHLSYANTMNPQQTPLAVWTLARSYALHQAMGAPGFFLERLRDEALHGADFLMRMQDPEDFWYTTVFDTWSKDPQQRELCSYKTQQGHKSADYQAGWRQGGGMAIAALATASRLGDGSSYSGEAYLNSAIRGFQHLQKHGKEYLDDGRENLIDHSCALLAAAELSASGHNMAEACDRRLAAVKSLLLDLDGFTWLAMDESLEQSWFHASDTGIPILALIRTAESLPAQGEQARKLAQQILIAQCELNESVNNPFSYPPHWVKTPGRSGRLQWFYPHDNPSGYWWQGENARLASLACAAWSLSPYLPEPEKKRVHQASQYWVDWILGRNPFDVCMLQGHGRNNPNYDYGYENAPGGVCNGITSAPEDEEDVAFAPLPWAEDAAHSWRWGEQWIPHAAWLLLALSHRRSLLEA